jgi:hypothetical protein
MNVRTAAGLAVALCAYIAFVAGARLIGTRGVAVTDAMDSVVLPPSLQTVLYLGDRYLAANVESTRVLATGGDLTGARNDYFHRLHLAVADLNPCHEDNYYIANALLAWGGGVDPAIGILKAATACRFWDEVPPFFNGVNLYFFKRQHLAARDMLLEAARRATENRAGYERFAIMVEAETMIDLRTAHRYLVSQRDHARDVKLRGMLDLRIGRLEGLIALNDAQEAFEKRFGRKLEDPNSLLQTGIMKAFPLDPMRLGYEFADGRFSMRELKIRGLERPRQ